MSSSSPAHRPTIAKVVDEMLTLLSSEVLNDLAHEDPATAVEIHFAPIRVAPLPGVLALGEDCSTDGFYDAIIDPTRPTIVFDANVSAARSHFTILHELGHHLFATTAAHLLDDLDRIGALSNGAQAAEERACHEFAARVLIPDSALVAVLPGDHLLLPQHLLDLHERTNASWDAIAVRCVNATQARVAVVLLREPGVISTGVAAPRLRGTWWPRGALVDPGGPLARAFSRDHRAQKEYYRHNLAFAEQLYCDTLKIHDQLVVAVLADRPSDGHFDFLEQPTASWAEKEEFCLWDGDERDVGWCDICRGRRCRRCDRCGCTKPIATPTCPGCGLPNPTNPGSVICRSCVMDGREWPPPE